MVPLTVLVRWHHPTNLLYLWWFCFLAGTNSQPYPRPQFPLYNSYAPNFFGSAPMDYVLSSYMSGGFKFQGPTPAPANKGSGSSSGEGPGGKSASSEASGHEARGGKGGAQSLTPIWPAFFPAYAPQFAQAPPGTASLLFADAAGNVGRGAKGNGQNGGGNGNGKGGAAHSSSGSAEKARGKKDRRHRMLVINRNGKGVVDSYWLG